MAIVFNGSPMFTGGADSGESNIRRWIIENDWLEAIVALPDQMFYNTGISTYICLPLIYGTETYAVSGVWPILADPGRCGRKRRGDMAPSGGARTMDRPDSPPAIPVLRMPEAVRLICLEAPLPVLFANLSVHKLDVVLADSPVSPALNVRAYNHVLLRAPRPL